VTPSQELWACALHMLKEHGDDAEVRAAERADALLDEGDFDGRRVWLTILGCIETARAMAATKALAPSSICVRLTAPSKWERIMLRLIAVTALIALSATGASAQKFDKNGRCHAANGQFAKADVCAGKMGATPADASASGYKLDAKGNCHDAKGKMAKKDLCAAK
jgi:hypothetical protein